MATAPVRRPRQLAWLLLMRRHRLSLLARLQMLAPGWLVLVRLVLPQRLPLRGLVRTRNRRMRRAAALIAATGS